MTPTLSMLSTPNHSLPIGPSVDSINNSRHLLLYNNSVLFETPARLLHAENMSSRIKRHHQFYFADGNVIFLVENTLFKVHQYFFQRDSYRFRIKFEATSELRVEGIVDERPLVLSHIKSVDFVEFLSILYPTDFRHTDEKKVTQWISVLHLACEWGFETIKLLSIDRLNSTATAVEKSVLGRRYNIYQWLVEAYELGVCARTNPSAIEESIQFGTDDAIKHSAIGNAYGPVAVHYEPSLLSLDLRQTFGLASHAEREKLTEHEQVATMKDLREKIRDASTDAMAESVPTFTGLYDRRYYCNVPAGYPGQLPGSQLWQPPNRDCWGNQICWRETVG